MFHRWHPDSMYWLLRGRWEGSWRHWRSTVETVSATQTWSPDAYRTCTAFKYLLKTKDSCLPFVLKHSSSFSKPNICNYVLHWAFCCKTTIGPREREKKEKKSWQFQVTFWCGDSQMGLNSRSVSEGAHALQFLTDPTTLSHIPPQSLEPCLKLTIIEWVSCSHFRLQSENEWDLAHFLLLQVGSDKGVPLRITEWVKQVTLKRGA